VDFREKYISRYLEKIRKNAKYLNEWELEFMASIVENYTDREGNASAKELAKRLTAKQYNHLREIAERIS